MADNYIISKESLEDIADAIRTKTGSSEKIAASDFVSAIESISGSGGGNIVLLKYYTAKSKQDNAYQNYYEYIIDGMTENNDIIYSDTNRNFTFATKGKYYIHMLTSASGGTSYNDTTTTVYYNDTAIESFSCVQSTGAVYKSYTWDAEVGDIFKIYNISSGWHTVGEILIYKEVSVTNNSNSIAIPTTIYKTVQFEEYNG